MTRSPAYLKRYTTLLSRYIDLETGDMIDRNFKEGVEKLRLLNRDTNYLPKIRSFIEKEYRFPFALHEVIEAYILVNTVRLDLIKPTIFLSSPLGDTKAYREYSLKYGYTARDRDRLEAESVPVRLNELKIVIGEDVTTDQIIDFVRANKRLIKDSQKMLRSNGTMPSRTRPVKNAKRDARVQELRDQRKTDKQIQDTINKEFDTAIGYGDIPTILRNLEKRRKPNN